MIATVGLSKGDFIGDTNVAIQQALDVVGAYGGGVVEVGPGIYTLWNSLRLHRNVRLVGSGMDTVLRKCDGVESQFAVDADYGQMKVTAKDASGFRAGMGAVVKDNRSDGWIDTVATVMLVQGNVIYLNTRFLMDYDTDAGGIIYNSFPLIAGLDVDSVVIEGLQLDGNRATNRPINGCVGGGIYLHRARQCRLADCVVRNFAGDGISFQTTQDITVERCEVIHATGLGLHPGTGSERPVVRNCKSLENDLDGLFLCWRVQEGRFENNEIIGNGRFGISIGHKDTDNLFLDNIIRSNKSHGIYFRDEKTTNAGSRNTFQSNVIEDNEGCGVFIDGYTTDLIFEENTIRDTRSGSARTQRTGLCAGPNAARVRAVRNKIENHLEAATEGEVTLEI